MGIFNKYGQVLSALILLVLAACSPKVEEGSGRFYSAQQKGIDFQNIVEATDSLNIIKYLYYYNGGGVAAGDINNDGWSDLFFTANQGPDKLYLNQGDFTFKDISKKAGIDQRSNWSTGVNMTDVNGDGWLDISVCQVGGFRNLKGRNQLYINNQDGTFTEQAEQLGVAHQGFSTQTAFLDFDQDGDLDMYLLCHSVHPTGTFRDTASRKKLDVLAGDKLFRNEGNIFTEVTEQAGIVNGSSGYGLGVAIADLNRDGCPDIYVSNDFHEDDFLYYNNCDGTFSEGGKSSLGHTSQFSMGVDIGDINNDGWSDILTADMKPFSEEEVRSSAGPEDQATFEFKKSFGYNYQYPHNALQVNLGKAKGAEIVQ